MSIQSELHKIVGAIEIQSDILTKQNALIQEQNTLITQLIKTLHDDTTEIVGITGKVEKVPPK